jgi:hypothetical protein
MSEDHFKVLAGLITEVKVNTNQICQQLRIVDKRLSLIEQRLENIEPWISADHSRMKSSESTNV